MSPFTMHASKHSHAFCASHCTPNGDKKLATTAANRKSTCIPCNHPYPILQTKTLSQARTSNQTAATSTSTNTTTQAPCSFGASVKSLGSLIATGTDKVQIPHHTDCMFFTHTITKTAAPVLTNTAFEMFQSVEAQNHDPVSGSREATLAIAFLTPTAVLAVLFCIFAAIRRKRSKYGRRQDTELWRSLRHDSRTTKEILNEVYERRKARNARNKADTQRQKMSNGRVMAESGTPRASRQPLDISGLAQAGACKTSLDADSLQNIPKYPSQALHELPLQQTTNIFLNDGELHRSQTNDLYTSSDFDPSVTHVSTDNHVSTPRKPDRALQSRYW